jgi:hypothetical protein
LNYIATCRDLFAFEYVSSSALPALRSQPPRSAAVSALIAQGNQDNESVGGDSNNEDNNDEFLDINTLDFDDLVDLQLNQPSTAHSLSTTQLRLQRMEGTTDTHCPGTLPPRLYQSNPFAQQQDNEETHAITYELTAKEVPATAKEIQALEDDEEEDIALSQVTETMVTTRVGRKRKATSKAVENAVMKKELKKAKLGGRKQ